MSTGRARSVRESRTRRLIALAFFVAAVTPAAADPAADFDAALAKWRSAAPPSYTFFFEWGGGVQFAPACADARIRVRVRNGVGRPPVVVRGARRCPKGTRGERSIGFEVPATIDEAFAMMRRYIFDPPTSARITATYDPVYGVPLTYYVEKLQLTDNDEGFRIRGFTVDP